MVSGESGARPGNEGSRSAAQSRPRWRSQAPAKPGVPASSSTRSMSRWSCGVEAPAKASVAAPGRGRTGGCRGGIGSSRAWVARWRRSRSGASSTRSPRRSCESAARSPAVRQEDAACAALDDCGRDARILNVRERLRGEDHRHVFLRSVLSHWRMRAANTGSSRNSHASSRISIVGAPSKRSSKRAKR